MRTHETARRARTSLAVGFALLALITVATTQAALAGSGGVGTGGGGGGSHCKSGKQAKLSHGLAIPPCTAPHRVKRVIRAADDIAKGHPYCYGGGHRRFKSSCYDCSGAVSYALHGGHLLSSPLDSSGLARWGRKGRGDWLTVYGNSGHAYMVVAGLRFDTSMTPGGGPGWSSEMRSSAGYRARHWRHL